MTSFADAIEDFSNTYTVTRRAAGTWVKGKHLPGSPSTFEIRASVQPMSGEELLRLPEGMQTSEVRRLFTATKLVARAGNAVPDEVAIDDDRWEVQLVESWHSLGGFYSVVVRRVEEGG